MEVGARVWAAGGPHLWQDGVVSAKTQQGDKYLIKVTLDKGGVQEYTVSARDEDDSDKVKMRNVAGQATVVEGAGVADLTTLTHLHEPAILHSVHERYKHNVIYTYTGPILLAVNPFKKVELYSDKLLAAYKGDGERRMYDPNYVESLAPHVYAIADKAYRNMTLPTSDLGLRSQSILVSGESGAGKTETCKIIMKYLAILGNATGDGMRLGEIEQQVLKSNPILEAFGNARTVRNDNSSRFGKYIQILFNEAGKLTGATIKTFLLEKVRVVKQTALERNYHVFYMLGHVAKHGNTSAERRARWQLRPNSDYHYTNQSGCFDRRDGVQDADLMVELTEAFGAMGFSQGHIDDLLDVCTATLALGNVSFVDIPGAKDSDQQAKVLESCRAHLDTAATLLGVTSEAIISSLTSRQVNAGLNHQVTIWLTPEQANHARDALAKAVYAAAFEWVVRRVNDCIDRFNSGNVGEIRTDKTFIGLLDIFGFEIFTSNYFEQFLINYANEVLQQQFNDFVFRQEQEEYGREGIQWKFIAFPDNKDCIELIERKPNGIIPTLDEQCLIGKATDDRFARELYKKCEGNRRFDLTNKLRVEHGFIVKHYAGDVTYSTTGIIEKNRDTLQQEGVDLLMSSQSDFVQLMGEIETAAVNQPKTKGAPTPRHARKPPARRVTIGARSLGTQFKDNLNNLVTVINLTHPHYVRCIKPNDELKPALFNYERIAEQLRNAGVLEVVRVARAGFPVRLGIQEFVDRYGLLAVQVVEAAYRRTAHEGAVEQERAVCKALIAATIALTKGGDSMAAGEAAAAVATGVQAPAAFADMCREQGMQMGLTKVFFQQKAFNKIEKLRTAIVASAATRIQTFFRCRNLRRKYLILKGVIEKRDDGRRRRGLAACTIQRCARRWLHRKRRVAALAAAAAAEQAAFQARLDELRREMQAEIDALKVQLAEAQHQLAISLVTSKRLRNRIVVVAGGAGGIGPVLAARLASEGAKIVVVDVGASGAAAVLTAAGVSSDSVAFVEADVTTEAGAKEAMLQASKRFGGVDSLVNVPREAASAPLSGPLEGLVAEQWLKSAAAATTAPLFCLKHALPLLRPAGGCVVNVAASGTGAPTDGALAALTAATAAAAGACRINCVTHTVGNGSAAPLGRAGTAEDVAAAVVHLLSDGAAFVSGHNLVVDGGASLRK